MSRTTARYNPEQGWGTQTEWHAVVRRCEVHGLMDRWFWEVHPPNAAWNNPDLRPSMRPASMHMWTFGFCPTRRRAMRSIIRVLTHKNVGVRPEDVVLHEEGL